ncbi:unnamed protein product [Coregonus sp. 'balchen']|nr:unnamed protein product [Coregonus sp. 'balchen']
MLDFITGQNRIDKFTSCFGFILFVATSLGLLRFMLANLLALFYITRGWLEEVVFRNNKGRYRYYAFVSYSEKDEHCVVEELLPNLEQRAETSSWGRISWTNITDSLYSSCRTTCLVSRHYLRSNCCSLEMKLATDQLLVEDRDILILVFLEDIPPRQLSAHHRLARLMKTRTYLDWPEELEQYPAFWDRLRATLVPKHGH